MKLYLTTRNKFFFLSILILLLSLFVIFKLNNDILGNFLLGIFASTAIITLQYNLLAKVEEGKLIVEKLKKMRDICYDFYEFDTFSVDYFSLNFEEKYNNFKNELKQLFELNDELGELSDLSKSTKKKLNTIINKVTDLELELIFIFENFEKQTVKMKIIYFMEFYKIIKNFKFKELINSISELGSDLDFKEFYKGDYKKAKNRKIKNKKYETSIQIYNKQLEKNNSVEYKALKNTFEKFLK